MYQYIQYIKTHIPIFIKSPLSSKFNSINTNTIIKLNLITNNNPNNPQINKTNLLSILQPHFYPLPSINQF